MKCPKCHGTNVGMRASLLIWKDTEKRAKIIVRCLDGCGSWTFLDNVTPVEQPSRVGDAATADGASAADNGGVK